MTHAWGDARRTYRLILRSGMLGLISPVAFSGIHRRVGRRNELFELARAVRAAEPRQLGGGRADAGRDLEGQPGNGGAQPRRKQRGLRR